MRKVIPATLESARIQRPGMASEPGQMYGLFEMRHPKSRYRLRVISSGEAHEGPTDLLSEIGAWEHVSVSIIGKTFCPSWEEMCFVKDLFWSEDECVIQFHPPEDVYVNTASHVLHLWKPPYDVPTPPMISVGIRGLNLG